MTEKQRTYSTASFIVLIHCDCCGIFCASADTSYAFCLSCREQLARGDEQSQEPA